MKNEAARSVLCRHWAGEPRPYAGKLIIYGPLDQSPPRIGMDCSLGANASYKTGFANVLLFQKEENLELIPVCFG